MSTGDDNLYKSTDVAKWRSVLSNYDKVIKAKFSSKNQSRMKVDVLALDKWYQSQLPKAIQKRKEKYVSKDELIKLMSWKLSRGKFRPTLNQLVKTNEEEKVIAISKKAFNELPDATAACKTLTELKAVGPATASAILCAGAPDAVPFMADDAMLGVSDLGQIKYDIAFYKKYVEKVTARAKELNAFEKSNFWNAHKVELALWTHNIAAKLHISLTDKRAVEIEESDCKSKKLKS